jgi:4-hydroxy-2-oxoheptanedioate aldolase
MKRPLQLGLCIMYPSPGVIERIGSDWDWYWLDGQHGQMAGYDAMLAMVRACDFVNRPAFVRVPRCDPAWIGLALDMGAAAIIVPQIHDEKLARDAVNAAKFPPLGDRSYGGRRVIDLHGRTYNKNLQPKLICQIESPEAVENADKIAAIDGVDALFFGPDDYMLRMGHSMDKPANPQILDKVVEHVASVCLRHDKDTICVTGEKDSILRYMQWGVNYIAVGSDVGLLAGTSRKTRKEIGASLEQYFQCAPKLRSHESEAIY